MIRTIADGGINWIWYLQGEFNETEKTVHIFFYDRWHRFEDRGSKHPKHEQNYNQNFLIMEDKARQVFGIRLGDIEYLVTNPGYIFGYQDMTHYEAE